MKSELEKRIMKKVYLMSLYKSFKARVPLKVFLLTIILSLSTKIISYKTIYNYFTDLDLQNKITYIYGSIINAPFLKISVFIIVLILVFSVFKDFIFALVGKKKNTFIKKYRY